MVLKVRGAYVVILAPLALALTYGAFATGNMWLLILIPAVILLETLVWALVFSPIALLGRNQERE